MARSLWPPVQLVVMSRRTRKIRAFWRLALFVVCFVALTLLMRAVRLLLTGRARPDFESATAVSEPYFLLYRATGVIALVAATYLALRFLERKTWADLGCHLSVKAGNEFAKGSVLGIMIMGFPFLVLLATDHAVVRGVHLDPSTLRALLLQFLPVTLLVGLWEEILFRGYPFQVVCEGVGPTTAIIGLALLFGMVHYQNPQMTLLPAVYLSMWGILLSLLLLRTRSLWACVGLHFTGNLTQGFFLNSWVSGTRYTSSMLEVEYLGPDWLTGGLAGLEASLPAFLGCVFAIMWILRGRWWTPGKKSRLLFSRPLPE